MAYNLNNNKPIILLGSSYSAALSLLIAKDRNKLHSLIVFSAGEHLKGIKLVDKISGIKIPVFATSAKKEIEETQAVLANIDPKLIYQFKPEEAGFHGSKILWESVKGFDLIWNELVNFLSS